MCTQECLFDVEWPRNHPRLTETAVRAEDNGIQLAISNPCFELWLILHLEDQRGFLDTPAANRTRRLLDGSRHKEVDPALYIPKRSVARDRAKKLMAMHQGNATEFPHDNPSSGMCLFVDAVEPQARA